MSVLGRSVFWNKRQSVCKHLRLFYVTIHRLFVTRCVHVEGCRSYYFIKPALVGTLASLAKSANRSALLLSALQDLLSVRGVVLLSSRTRWKKNSEKLGGRQYLNQRRNVGEVVSAVTSSRYSVCSVACHSESAWSDYMSGIVDFVRRVWAPFHL